MNTPNDEKQPCIGCGHRLRHAIDCKFHVGGWSPVLSHQRANSTEEPQPAQLVSHSTAGFIPNNHGTDPIPERTSLTMATPANEQTTPPPTPPHSIKVFRMNDFDWWAADSLDSAKAGYMAEGYGQDEETAFDNPYELSPEQMQTHTMKEFDEDWDYERDPDGDDPTFQDCLDLMIRKGDSFPCVFASTEY